MIGKYKKVLWLSYVIVLISLVFYVRNTLNDDFYVVKDNEQITNFEEAKEAKVRLSVNIQGNEQEYSLRLTTKDSVEDMLKTLREDQGLYYEKDMYAYGIEITEVMDTLPKVGNKWAVMYEGSNITASINDTYLVHNASYVLTEVEE